jgi:diguanylate cyclase (GGDEF)-like protein
MSEKDPAAHEKERLAALQRYDVLDTPPEEAFERVTRLARTLLGVPIATVAFIDSQRVWFKSGYGMPAKEAPRELAFCNHAIQQDGPLIVPDALVDPRFADNPSVIGEPHIRFYCGICLRTGDGHNIGTLEVIDRKPRSLGPGQVELLADLARIVVDALELRMLAATDCLTGVMSRRAFRDAARRDFALARRHKQELSCILLDIDNFKPVNDTHGHAAGDIVLQGIANICRQNLRASDYIGRLGGEEFGVMLPQTSSRSALQAAERLRKAIKRENFVTPFGALTVTASLGLAPCDKTVADVAALLRRAEVALYGAKSAGRNRCVNFATQNLKAVLRVA